MKYENRLSYLNLFLNITIVVISLPFLVVPFIPFNKSMNMMTMSGISQIIIELMFLGGYIMVILTLKKILKSIRNQDPFNPNNILYFKKIGNYIFIIGIIYAIISYPKPSNSILEIMVTSYGSLKPMFFLYMVLSILSFILSDVFRMAMEIKDENDLTV